MIHSQEATAPALRRGALHFPAILMQAITHIAPAVGLVLTVQFIASVAGVAAPSAYALAFLIVLMLGLSLTQLAKHYSNAGGYYTYISRTIHPRAGFLAAWLYFLYDPFAATVNLAFLGYFFENTFKGEFGITVPWWTLFVPLALLVSFLAYRGIEISVHIMVWLALIEIVIMMALAISGILMPGDGGVNARSFVPAPSSHNGVFLGVVFSIFAFTGFESVAPLAEESVNPKRNLPLSIVLSILLMGAFFIFCSWGLMIGWGTNHVDTFAKAAENPCVLLAKRLWGKAWVLVNIAVLNSILGASIAGTNASARVFFAMGRSGSLPRMLAKVHPRYRTPVNALLLQTLITLLAGLGLGIWIGPEQEFYLLGVSMTLALIVVYVLGNAGVVLLFHRERRREFRLLLHLLFPLGSTAALIWVAYKSVVPLPALPIGYGPFIVGGWLLLGLIPAFAFDAKPADQPSSDGERKQMSSEPAGPA